VRILHLHSGNIFGGIESMLTTIARQRGRATRVEHEFALAFDGRLAAELTDAGAPPALLGPVRLAHPWTVRRARRALADLLAAARPDAVVTHLPWTHAVFAAEIGRSGSRTVLWLHGPATGMLHRWAMLTPPDAVISNSAFTESSLPSRYRRLPRAVVHCPLSAPLARTRSERAHTRATLSTAPDAVVLLQASRLERWKGHEVLLRALAQVANVPGWAAWIAGGAHQPGERRYEQRLRSLARELGIAPRVRFLGEQTDVARLMAAADVYCQPNTAPEPFGLACVEALYAGLPVVGTDAGGVREIVTSDCGVLLPAGSVDAVAAAIRDLLQDPVRRQQLGAAGPARAASLCDPARQLRRLEQFVDGLADRRGAA
jgi:glycosyltransferase involved in cell wall biosynthesis